ncbi:MAG: hypothetical protein ACKO0Z_11690 [Betaproteobacteria bacterium]
MGLYEISGNDYGVLGAEILGADDYLLGAAAPMARAAMARAAQVKQAGGLAVQNSQPTKARELPLGFDSVANVAAGATAQITERPQVTFRPDRFVVAAAIAEFFLINDIKVGKDSQLIGAAAIPAEAFSNLSVGVSMKMDTANVGIDVLISVTNIDAAAHRFNGTLIGPAVA